MVWNTGLCLARWGQPPPPGCAPSWIPVKINPVLAKPRTDQCLYILCLLVDISSQKEWSIFQSFLSQLLSQLKRILDKSTLISKSAQRGAYLTGEMDGTGIFTPSLHLY